MKVLSILSEDKKRRIVPIPSEILQKIGEMTVNFAMIEQTIKKGLTTLLFPYGHYEDIENIVLSEMSFKRHVELLQCLCSHRCDKQGDSEKLREICSRISNLEAQRNVITHSYWGYSPKDGKAFRMKTTAKSKGIRHQDQAITVADIDEIALGIGEAAKILEDFIDSIEPDSQEFIDGCNMIIGYYQDALASHRAERISSQDRALFPENE